MKRMIIMALIAGATAFGGCSADKGKELLDTAQFEEKQHNEEHARKLYEEIVTKYPGTEFAAEASERLKVLSRK